MEVVTWILGSHEENFAMLRRESDAQNAVIIENPRSSDFGVSPTSYLHFCIKTYKFLPLVTYFCSSYLFQQLIYHSIIRLFIISQSQFYLFSQYSLLRCWPSRISKMERIYKVQIHGYFVLNLDPAVLLVIIKACYNKGLIVKCRPVLPLFVNCRLTAGT